MRARGYLYLDSLTHQMNKLGLGASFWLSFLFNVTDISGKILSGFKQTRKVRGESCGSWGEGSPSTVPSLLPD